MKQASPFHLVRVGVERGIRRELCVCAYGGSDHKIEFLVDMSVMSAKRKFQEVDGGESFTIGENKITTRWLNHPQGCLGFRIETPAGIVAYATDNEPGNDKLDESLQELVAGADIFVNDAQFTREQLGATRKGWGHSSWLEGVKTARQAGAKTLVLFHHDPDSTDRMVDWIF